MTKQFATYLSCLVSVGLLLGACNRPVAYYQRSPVVHYSTSHSTFLTSTAQTKVAPVEQSIKVTESTVSVEPTGTVFGQSAPAIDPLSASVRNDSKLASDKQLSKRANRLNNLLSESATKATLSSNANQHKMTLLERFMLKKLNKTISKHLSPDNSKKTMINGGLLSGSLILLIGGILLLALTSGTAAVIGLIAAIIGAIGLIFGLLAS